MTDSDCGCTDVQRRYALSATAAERSAKTYSNELFGLKAMAA